MKVLDVGSGSGSVAAIVLKELDELDITRVDANAELHPDVVADITKPLPEEMIGQYDLVYASHVLEHIDRNNVVTVLRNLASALKVGGQIWVLVPSMEWAAKEILQGRDNAGVQGAIFGGQQTPWDYHRCGFDLNNLRHLVELVGVRVEKAYQAPLLIEMYGKEFHSLQNVVIGTLLPKG